MLSLRSRAARADAESAPGLAISARLAPTIGSGLLIADLHTPQRFYNMLRVAKSTSPMSIGTWILMAFSGGAVPSALAQGLSSLFPRARWLHRAARIAQVPAAVAGTGLSVYTAALLSATSTPTWAAAPRSLAVRFGASSMASASAALALGSGSSRARGALQAVTVGALAVEAAATLVQDHQIERKGADEAKRSAWGMVEKVAVLGLGVATPLGLFVLSRLLKDQKSRDAAADAACVAVMAGSAMLRVAVMEIGDISAKRPEVSFRFSAPENLPKAVKANRVGMTEQTALPYPAG